MDKGDILDSWKEISRYLGRDVRTCQRWERGFGLPVHRLDSSPKARVYAYTRELDAWRDGRGHLPGISPIRKGLVALGLLALTIAVLVFLRTPGLRDRVLGRTGGGRATSIAVLPVLNSSGDPDQEVFADGMTDALITGLGQIQALSVRSFRSAMHYKGTNETMPQISKELGVERIVEASLRYSANRVSLTVRLIDAPNDRQLWTRVFDRETTDVLALQSDLVQDIASEIRVRVTPQESARIQASRRISAGAYEAVIRGRYFFDKWTEDGFKKAINYFQDSIDIEPGFAMAYAGLAKAYRFSLVSGYIQWNEALPRVRAAARKALDLDSNLAEAHSTLAGVISAYDWNWAEADREFRRALELNPNSSESRLDYGGFLIAMGHKDEAVNEVRRALELDPLSTHTSMRLGWVLYYAGRYDESIAQLNKTQELDPNFWFAHMVLSWDYERKGMRSESVAECRRALELSPEEPNLLGSCGRVFALAGERAEALKCLEKIQIISARQSVDHPVSLAWLYDGLGDVDRSIECLERAYRARSPGLQALKIETYSDRLRSDPRFRDLVRRMNYPR